MYILKHLHKNNVNSIHKKVSISQRTFRFTFRKQCAELSSS